jgi:hypothetical protein
MAAGKIALGLVFEPTPQIVGNDETENTITKEFEALVPVLDGCAGPTATTFADERARMS